MAASAFNLRSFEYTFMSNILAWVRYLRKLLLELLFYPLVGTSVNNGSKGSRKNGTASLLKTPPRTQVYLPCRQLLCSRSYSAVASLGACEE